MLKSRILVNTTHLGNDSPGEVKWGNYPGGEVYLKDPVDLLMQHHSASSIDVDAELFDSDSVFALMQFKDALDRNLPGKDKMLELRYLPYARQDRVKNGVSGNESLSLKLFAKLIDSMGWDLVVLNDPHSDVAAGLFNTPTFIRDRAACFDYTMNAFNVKRDTLENSILLSPDAGALKTSHELVKKFGFKDLVVAEKIRNLQTGVITGTRVYDVEKLEGQDVFICDDIFDGGRTFIEISKAIKAAGVTVKSLSVYVTHGMFTKGVEGFHEYFDNIYVKYDYQLTSKTEGTERHYQFDKENTDLSAVHFPHLPGYCTHPKFLASSYL